MNLYTSTCEKPGCGRQTSVLIISEVLAYISKDQSGGYVTMHLCPEHKAAWSRLVSEFFTNE